jgi:hypothetical protein
MPVGVNDQPPEVHIRRDPLAYPRKVRENCRALDQYTSTLIRQERRGLVPSLHPPEEILCWPGRTSLRAAPVFGPRHATARSPIRLHYPAPQR